MRSVYGFLSLFRYMFTLMHLTETEMERARVVALTLLKTGWLTIQANAYIVTQLLLLLLLFTVTK